MFTICLQLKLPFPMFPRSDRTRHANNNCLNSNIRLKKGKFLKNRIASRFFLYFVEPDDLACICLIAACKTNQKIDCMFVFLDPVIRLIELTDSQPLDLSQQIRQ